MSDLQDAAQEMYDMMKTKTRKDGSTFITLSDNAPGWMQDAAREAHLGEMPNDWIYDKIDTILEYISDYEDEDDMYDALYEIEPDPYYTALTSWLAENTGRVDYLTRALEEFGSTDGFQALSMAQGLHIQAIGHALISEISGIVDYRR